MRRADSDEAPTDGAEPADLPEPAEKERKVYDSVGPAPEPPEPNPIYDAMLATFDPSMSSHVDKALCVYNELNAAEVALEGVLHDQGFNVGHFCAPSSLSPKSADFEGQGRLFREALKRLNVRFLVAHQSAHAYAKCISCNGVQIEGGDPLHACFSLAFIGLGPENTALLCGAPCCALSNSGLFADREIAKVAVTYDWEYATHKRDYKTAVHALLRRIGMISDRICVLPWGYIFKREFGRPGLAAPPSEPFVPAANAPVVRLDETLIGQLEKALGKDVTAQVDILEELGMSSSDAYALYKRDPYGLLRAGLPLLGKKLGDQLFPQLALALRKFQQISAVGVLNRWMKEVAARAGE